MVWSAGVAPVVASSCYGLAATVVVDAGGVTDEDVALDYDTRANVRCSEPLQPIVCKLVEPDGDVVQAVRAYACLLYTSPSPRDS
ncbi:MAG: hypothetical protein QUS33_07335, partial [Dehalococcoidia bacterium]|nr:hypothetical protein [Dehalococcoidia bacterium]